MYVFIEKLSVNFPFKTVLIWSSRVKVVDNIRYFSIAENILERSIKETNPRTIVNPYFRFWHMT